MLIERQVNHYYVIYYDVTSVVQMKMILRGNLNVTTAHFYTVESGFDMDAHL